MHLALCVVPIQSDADVLLSRPVRLDFVFCSKEGGDEVSSVLFPDVLHAEIVDYQGELDRTPQVPSETGNTGALPVPQWAELLLEVLFCKQA